MSHQLLHQVQQIMECNHSRMMLHFLKCEEKHRQMLYLALLLQHVLIRALVDHMRCQQTLSIKFEPWAFYLLSYSHSRWIQCQLEKSSYLLRQKYQVDLLKPCFRVFQIYVHSLSKREKGILEMIHLWFLSGQLDAHNKFRIQIYARGPHCSNQLVSKQYRFQLDNHLWLLLRCHCHIENGFHQWTQ